MSLIKAAQRTKKERNIEDIKSLKQETVRLNVGIPRALSKKIKLRALNEDTTIAELVNKAIKEYLNKSSEE